MIPPPQLFQDYLKANEIKRTSRVVLYDTKAGQPFFATRCWWMFNIYGLKNVSVLGGGLTKWIAEGKPTATKENAGTEDDYKLEFNPDMLMTFEQILELEEDLSVGHSDV